jgi:hypothetical protein
VATIPKLSQLKGPIVHLGKFHFVLAELHREIKREGTQAKLQKLIQTLTEVSNNPGNASPASAYKDALEELRQSLGSAPLNTPHPTLAIYLDSINARAFIGDHLFSRVKAVIEANQLAPQQAASGLQTLLTETEKFHNLISTADDAFTELEVEYTEIDPGENEIGISIPVIEGTKTLKDLAKDANSWHKALAPFAELYGNDHEPIRLRVMSSSDWQFYLYSIPPVVLGISVCIKSINQVLRDLINSKQLIKQLASTGMSEAVIEAAQVDADARLEIELRRLADCTVDKNYLGGDEGRQNELKNAFSQSMKFMAHQIANGVTVEVRLIPPLPPTPGTDEAPDSAEMVEKIAKADELTGIARSIEQNMQFPQLDGNSTETLVLPGIEDDDVD